MRLVLLRMLVAFFVGVVVTVYLLVPGGKGPTILVHGDKQVQLANLNRAGEQIAKMTDMTAFYTHKAKERLQQRLSGD